ncbi:hypothetical protein B0H14DRAFT_2579678 [Mycena olivaceomarginata]|nr:hypothetical protein B0H14DRAFT_2579678 [Mycena olivaceomarginata]
MPPRGSGAALSEEVFRFNDNKTKVQCKVCTAGVPEGLRLWIFPQSGAKHLQSDDHKKASELVEDAKRKAEERERERLAESATRDLRELTFAAASNVRGPVHSMTSSNGPSLAKREFWDDYAVNGADFSAGDPADDSDIQIGRLREQVGAFGLWNPEKAARQLGFGDEDVAGQILNVDEEEDFLAEIIRAAGIEEPERSSIDGQHDQAHSSPEWFPYPSKMMFLLDTLDNLPRLRISSSLMRVFLWILKEAGCKDVPSFDGLRRVQKNIRSDIGIPSIPCVSPLGNVFFMNDPRAIIAQDWSNPTTRKLIHVYPEIPEDGIIREIWHAQKWRKDMDLDCLSPMFDAGISHYYVNELSRLKNGDFIAPIRWVKFRGKVYCDAYSVTLDEKNEATIFDTETSLICTDDLANNYLNLKHAGAIPK